MNNHINLCFIIYSKKFETICLLLWQKNFWGDWVVGGWSCLNTIYKISDKVGANDGLSKVSEEMTKPTLTDLEFRMR